MFYVEEISGVVEVIEYKGDFAEAPAVTFDTAEAAALYASDLSDALDEEREEFIQTTLAEA